ncbi:MAG: S-layer protein domain-containing protein [Methanothrix sp.]
MALGLVSLSSAQEISEAASVRGHFAYGDGIWRADDFGWFYYDLDEDLSGEMLQIDLDGKTAEKGYIKYSSKVWMEQFQYQSWGSFERVAFFGKPYFAGYPESSITEEVSSLEKGELREVLMDDDITQTLSLNKTLALQQGYVLVAQEISEKKGTVNFLLLKDGLPVNSSVVSIGESFVYKIDDLPVIVVHLTNAMMGAGEGLADVEGVFQISDEPNIRLFEGAMIGEMKLTDYSQFDIVLENNRTINLKRDTVISLIPGLEMVVLDFPEPVYYPVGWIYDFGVHEIRGPTFNSSSAVPVRLGDYNSSVIAKWNAENYSGFYFDPDDAVLRDLFGALVGETLVIHSIEDRRIMPPSNPIVYQENKTVLQTGLQYTSLRQPKEFEYKPWGYYFTINLFGFSWFAGYDSSFKDNKSSKNLMENEYLGRVLIDRELQGNISEGNYSFEEGYEMRIRDVSDDSIFIQLFKEEQLVDSSVVESNTTYEYKKDLENVKDMPIIRIHFGNVFYDGNHGSAEIDGIFQISDNVFPMEMGSGLGEMELVNIEPEGMIFVNPDSITLSTNSTVNIGPGMDIRVADNDTLRYYLYTQTYVVPAPEPPLISTQKNVSSSQPANFSMIVRAAEIRQVLVNILDSSNRTVFSRDIASMGQGSGEWWLYAWSWNATEMHMSDDNSPVPDMGEGPLLALLYLNQSASPLQVAVTFDSQGLISTIMDGNAVYYMSREDYGGLNRSLDYSSMMNNSTARMEFFKVMPGESILQFFDLINNQFIPSGINHTLQGNLSSLEPHAIASGAEPGRYQLQVRLENAVNAIWATDEYFNVTDRYGFINDSISSRDSKINAVTGEGKSKKSPPVGILASILALTGAALFRRRG